MPHQAWLGNTRTGRIIALLILLFIGGVLTKGWVFERYTLEVEVHEALVPVNCNRATKGLFRRIPDQRDFVPEDANYAFCGLVWTDHGPFRLPQSTAMPLIQTDRATLAKALQAGCRYRIRVVETGQRPTTDPELERPAGRIIRILDKLGCT